VERPTLNDLASWATARVPDVIDDVVAAVRARLATYRDARIVSGDELRWSVTAYANSLAAVLAAPTAHPISRRPPNSAAVAPCRVWRCWMSYVNSTSC